MIQLAKVAAPVALASFFLCGCGSSSTSAGAPDTTPDAGGDDATTADTGADTGLDAPAEGGGEAGNPSLCNASAFLFCDGFEEGSDLGNWSQTYTSGGSAAVDNTHVYRGSYALRAHVDAITDAGVTAYAYVQQIQAWPAHIFVRYFAYEPSPHPPSAAGLVNVQQADSPYAGMGMLTRPPSGGLAMVTYGTGQDQGWESDAGAMAPDRWVCFEIEIDTGAGTSHLYMNDVEVPDLARSNLGLVQLGNVGVGLGFFQAPVQAAEDVWIDEVAVNGTRIGCAN